MTKREIILALLAAADGGFCSPIQVQTGVFIIDRRMPELVKEAGFSFHLYHCSPFDHLVQRELLGLAKCGDVAVLEASSSKTYGPTTSGLARGKELLGRLAETERKFVVDVAHLVRNLGFQESVAAVYGGYRGRSRVASRLESNDGRRQEPSRRRYRLPKPPQ